MLARAAPADPGPTRLGAPPDPEAASLSARSGVRLRPRWRRVGAPTRLAPATIGNRPEPQLRRLQAPAREMVSEVHPHAHGVPAALHPACPTQSQQMPLQMQPPLRLPLSQLPLLRPPRCRRHRPRSLKSTWRGSSTPKLWRPCSGHPLAEERPPETPPAATRAPATEEWVLAALPAQGVEQLPAKAQLTSGKIRLDLLEQEEVTRPVATSLLAMQGGSTTRVLDRRRALDRRRRHAGAAQRGRRRLGSKVPRAAL